MGSEKMLIREIILKVNLFWDLCMQTIENIPKNPEHVDNVPKRPENPDCNVQKVYPKFRHVPVWLYRGVTPRVLYYGKRYQFSGHCYIMVRKNIAIGPPNRLKSTIIK